MSKIKKLLETVELCLFPEMLQQTIQPTLKTTLESSLSKSKKLKTQASSIPPPMTNSSTLSETGTGSSAVSKPETLILNGRAKPSITTKDKNPKVGLYTQAMAEVVSKAMNQTQAGQQNQELLKASSLANTTQAKALKALQAAFTVQNIY